jgi:1,4-dihydroxy-2-naphthoate octaprenyltransferase
VARHGWVSFLAGGLLGLTVLAWGGRLWVLAFALPLVGLGYLYNSGERPLSYTRLGEWVTGLCYGPGVFGGLWLVAHQDIDLSALMGCAAFGCLAVAILLSHQPPQISTDRQAGKQSFGARYGAARTYQTARVLFLGFLGSWGVALTPRQPQALALYVALSCLLFARIWSREFGPKDLLLSATALFVVQALL